ncbi:hypothetical protein [Streptomyces murinus]|uniref:Uncharacterized protein n=1 Tax=Streptomyces murinus TaxID=33900 RepID=A0A7W3RL65_STRMR|nr:hypothetical protein [Streptomyces murinus]MBA9053746.1 hypothetical protein [Streptomyces murinus]UWW94840.1 hypothetical protein GO605_31385 [Streptomyces murinus]
MKERLLPWAGSDGKPCYVIGDGVGYVSRVADQVESVQLGMAGRLLNHTAELLAEQEKQLTNEELHYLVRRFVESLTEIKRIAESRGARLAGAVDQPIVET